MNKPFLWLLLALTPVCACACTGLSGASNPPAAGFDAAGSDARALQIADACMQSMGGRRAWDRARVLRWTFFGRRSHTWDKRTGDYLLEGPDLKVLMNLRTLQGRAWENGSEIADAEKLRATLDEAHSIWINDSYWLCMPHKLKDSGVTLGHRGEDKLPDGRAADVLTLRFKDVGDTPQNKYDVWVSRDRGLVEQWAYYATAADEQPKFVTPWAEWKEYGGVWLASSRGEKRELGAISVSERRAEDFRAP